MTLQGKNTVWRCYIAENYKERYSVDVSERESMAVLSGEIPASRCSALTTTTSK